MSFFVKKKKEENILLCLKVVGLNKGKIIKKRNMSELFKTTVSKSL